MDYRIIKTWSNSQCGYEEGPLTQVCNGSSTNYHVHILRHNYQDKSGTTFLAQIDEKYPRICISKFVYSDTKRPRGWGVIASTLSSLDLPSIDKSVIDLFNHTDKHYIDIDQSLCCGICINEEYLQHLNDGKTREERKKLGRLEKRIPCSFFSNGIPLNTNKDNFRFFWKNNKLFVLKRENGKIYEGLQWLNLSEEEKENMLK